MDIIQDNVKKGMEKANIQKVVATEEFSKLDEKEQEVFFQSISLDKKELDEKYFAEKDGKYLIITGTVPFSGTIKEEDYKRIIEQVVKEFAWKNSYGSNFIHIS